MSGGLRTVAREHDDVVDARAAQRGDRVPGRRADLVAQDESAGVHAVDPDVDGELPGGEQDSGPQHGVEHVHGTQGRGCGQSEARPLLAPTPATSDQPVQAGREPEEQQEVEGLQADHDPGYIAAATPMAASARPSSLCFSGDCEKSDRKSVV